MKIAVKNILAIILFISFETLFLLPSWATDNKSDLEETCQSLFQKNCDKITPKEYEKQCAMATFIWDEKGKIIGLNSKKESTKEGDILVVDITDIGCAHASMATLYYLKKEIATNINCKQLVKLWNEQLIKLQNSSTSYSAFEPTKAVFNEEENFNQECVLNSDLEVNPTISIHKSDIAGYKFFIEHIYNRFD